MRIGIFNTSAIICIMKGDFLATPPIPMSPFTGIPCSIKRSTIFLAPKQVASAHALNNAGASLPKLRLLIAAFNSWFASGVRLPLSQSIANSLCSVTMILAASLLNSGIIWSEISLIKALAVSGLINSDCLSRFCNGQANRFLNQA